jgi:hypothetical protein
MAIIIWLVLHFHIALMVRIQGCLTELRTGKSADSRPSGSAARAAIIGSTAIKRGRSRQWPMHQCRPTPIKDAPRQTAGP